MVAFLYPSRGVRALAALLPLSLCVGCHEPLALQDSYFMPGNERAAAHRSEAQHAVRYNRAVQAARQSCPAAGSPSVEAPPGPDRARARRASLARLCADGPAPPTAAYGGTGNAYRRWVEDRTRELPEATATAAGPAGGS